MNYITKSEILQHVDLHEESEFYTHHKHCENGCPDHKKRLWIKVNRHSIVGYCHNCGAKRIVKDNKRHKFKKTLDKSYIFSGLPADFSNSIPKEFKIWLYKYRIFDDDIDRFNIGWSDHYKRIILPVYHEGECVLWQGRAVYKDQSPKYLTYKNGKVRHMFISNADSEDSIVITEDIVSAIRASKVMDSLALLGTSISAMDQYAVINRYNKIYLWLDPDSAGRTGIIKLKRKLRTVNNTVCVINSKNDPKCYNDTEIKEFLNG